MLAAGGGRAGVQLFPALVCSVRAAACLKGREAGHSLHTRRRPLTNVPCGACLGSRINARNRARGREGGEREEGETGALNTGR